MGRIIRYVEILCAGSVAHKVLKWDFTNLYENYTKAFLAAF